MNCYFYLKKYVHQVRELKELKLSNGVLSSNFSAEATYEGTGGRRELKYSKKKCPASPPLPANSECFCRLFLKVMPENDGHGAFVRNLKLDVTEVEAYRTVLRDLVRRFP